MPSLSKSIPVALLVGFSGVLAAPAVTGSQEKNPCIPQCTAWDGAQRYDLCNHPQPMNPDYCPANMQVEDYGRLVDHCKKATTGQKDNSCDFNACGWLKEGHKSVDDQSWGSLKPSGGDSWGSQPKQPKGDDKSWPKQPKGDDNSWPKQPKGDDNSWPKQPKGDDNSWPKQPKGDDNSWVHPLKPSDDDDSVWWNNQNRPYDWTPEQGEKSEDCGCDDKVIPLPIDQKGGDQKGGDQKGGDQKGGDQKGGDQKGGDQKW